MSLIDIFKRKKQSAGQPTVIVFAGGMGTQILQAAVYLSMRQAEVPVYADLTYFDRPSQISEPGKSDRPTHWFWQLDEFGFPKSFFEPLPPENQGRATRLADGPKMMELGLAALSRPEIRRNFKDIADVRTILPENVLSSFLCVHVRRGDYLNVASHVVSDAEFIGLIRKFSGLVPHIVILSDSPIGPELRGPAAESFETALFLDTISPYASHQIMRTAKILVCSNSTFSLTAAALSEQTLVVVPRKWYSEKYREIEAVIHQRCQFQIMQ